MEAKNDRSNSLRDKYLNAGQHLKAEHHQQIVQPKILHNSVKPINNNFLHKNLNSEHQQQIVQPGILKKSVKPIDCNFFAEFVVHFNILVFLVCSIYMLLVISIYKYDYYDILLLLGSICAYYGMITLHHHYELVVYFNIGVFFMLSIYILLKIMLYKCDYYDILLFLASISAYYGMLTLHNQYFECK
jgi:hypothetical protein